MFIKLEKYYEKWLSYYEGASVIDINEAYEV
jgi:hypothetical protein